MGLFLDLVFFKEVINVFSYLIYIFFDYIKFVNGFSILRIWEVYGMIGRICFSLFV